MMTPAEMSQTERYSTIWTLLTVFTVLCVYLYAPFNLHARESLCALLLGFAGGRNYQLFILELRWMRIVERV